MSAREEFYLLVKLHVEQYDWKVVDGHGGGLGKVVDVERFVLAEECVDILFFFV